MIKSSISCFLFEYDAGEVRSIQLSKVPPTNFVPLKLLLLKPNNEELNCVSEKVNLLKLHNEELNDGLKLNNEDLKDEEL